MMVENPLIIASACEEGQRTGRDRADSRSTTDRALMPRLYIIWQRTSADVVKPALTVAKPVPRQMPAPPPYWGLDPLSSYVPVGSRRLNRPLLSA